MPNWTRPDGRPTPEATYMQLAFMWAEHSTCSRRKVGSVITTDDLRRTVGHGYNGGGVGMDDNACAHGGTVPGACEHLHAEENALLFCNYEGPKILFVTVEPCLMCAKRIVNKGNVLKVYYGEASYRDKRGLDYLHRAGIETYLFARPADPSPFEPVSPLNNGETGVSGASC
jgi:dCMP deaminase